MQHIRSIKIRINSVRNKMHKNPFNIYSNTNRTVRIHSATQNLKLMQTIGIHDQTPTPVGADCQLHLFLNFYYHDFLETRSKSSDWDHRLLLPNQKIKVRDTDLVSNSHLYAHTTKWNGQYEIYLKTKLQVKLFRINSWIDRSETMVHITSTRTMNLYLYF